MGIALSRETKHALLAMAYLARQPRDHFVPIQEIGAAAGIPKPFLAKILARLSRHGLLTSRRGPHGGVTLAQPPGEVSLRDVIRLFDGPREPETCYLGFRECDGGAPCPVHAVWSRVRDEMDRELDERTLADFDRAGLGEQPPAAPRGSATP